MKISSVAACLLGMALGIPLSAPAQPVSVRVVEPADIRALVLRSLDGRLLAKGSVTVIVAGGRATSQVVFHFSDGSVHDETTSFSQDGVFRLLSYRLLQNGPAFPRTLEMTLEPPTGRAVVRHKVGSGREEVEEETLTLSADVANGMMVPVLKNLTSNTASRVASWVAATPKPRYVKLAISRAGVESVQMSAGSGRRAIHYVVKAEIGGLSGLLAPLVGRQPPDTHVWILEGPPPVFMKSEGPLYVGGPVWRIEAP